MIALTTNSTNLLVACIGLVGVVITSGVSICALLIARENRRKLTTPGTDTGTIGEQVEKLQSN